ncbi:flagellar protein FliT [Burkholderia guangdongensis]|uniref:flagellar protein FliT n=1 Tax=Burkholderia guangdongensis TaxID=1792500 RepID=UPI0015CE9CF4|nr:flagellar protein FliT [Burkholderia guangdongensis]
MDSTNPIERIWALTQAIEHAAAMADWPCAARLVDERSPLVMALGAEQTPDALATIRRIQAIDAAVFAQAKTTQHALQIDFRAAIGRTDAARQYQRIAAGR